MVNKAPKKQSKKLAAASSGRVRKLDKKQQKAKAKKQAQKLTPLPGSFSLTKQVFMILRKFWKPLGRIVLVYLLLNVVFASGFISNIHTTASGLSKPHNLSDLLSNFGSLIGTGTGGSSSFSAAQSVLLVLESLVIIWALRQLLAGEVIRVKQAYYHSTASLIPFLLVIFVIILQLLPITLGAGALALILSAGGGFIVELISGILFVLLASWSLRMLSSSVFAIYIVTLLDMQPRQALRSAKNLVRFRRWQILRRLFFLPICVLVLIGVVMLPIILLVPFLVVPVFFVLGMLAVLFVHAYLYSLYRGLIA
jgi:hypothetical protein